MRLFDAAELRRLVFSLPDGAELMSNVAERASLNEFATSIVEALDRRGKLRELLSHVRAARPNAIDDVGRLEFQLAGERTPAGRLREAALQALSPRAFQPVFGMTILDTLVTWEEGRFFLLWAIPGASGVEVAVGELRQALSAEIPVLIVHGNDECSNWRWADDTLVHALAEAKQDSARIPFGPPDGDIRAFVSRTLSTFERPRWRWSPEAWGRLQARAAEIGRAVRALAGEAKAVTGAHSLEAASQRVEDARFIVAIAGPYRAGKSTLINALMEVPVSPVSRRPTTAVTVEFEAGAQCRTEVYFEDGTRTTGPAEQAFLATYATQDANKNNHRRVNFIRVSVPSPLLTQGVVLLDAPGLQDPNNAMVELATVAMERAHAILYVVDGAPFANGGFVLSQSVISDLRETGRRSGKKLLLLINKVDALAPDQREELTLLLREQIQEAGLDAHLLKAPMFLSADLAWKKFESGNADAPDGGLDTVRRVLWEELLEHGEIGFRQLRRSLVTLQQTTGDLATLLSARHASGQEAERLAAWANNAKDSMVRLHTELENAAKETERRAQRQMKDATEQITREFGAWLDQIPLGRELPSAADAESRLRRAFGQAAREVWSTIAVSLGTAEETATQVVEDVLRQARMTLEPRASRIAPVPPAIQVRFSPDTGVKAGVDFGIFGGTLGALFGGTLTTGIFGALLAFFSGIAGTQGKRRASDVARFKAEVNRSAVVALDSVSGQIAAHVNEQTAIVRRRVDDRLHGFVAAMGHRIGETGGTPLTETESKALTSQQHRARSLQSELGALVDDVFRVGMETSAGTSARSAKDG